MRDFLNRPVGAKLAISILAAVYAASLIIMSLFL